MFLRQLVKNVAASEWLTANGATGRTRTDDLRITNALLYQLSHSSIFNFFLLLCFGFKTYPYLQPLACAYTVRNIVALLALASHCSLFLFR